MITTSEFSGTQPFENKKADDGDRHKPDLTENIVDGEMTPHPAPTEESTQTIIRRFDDTFKEGGVLDKIIAEDKAEAKNKADHRVHIQHIIRSYHNPNYPGDREALLQFLPSQLAGALRSLHDLEIRLERSTTPPSFFGKMRRWFESAPQMESSETLRGKLEMIKRRVADYTRAALEGQTVVQTEPFQSTPTRPSRIGQVEVTASEPTHHIRLSRFAETYRIHPEKDIPDQFPGIPSDLIFAMKTEQDLRRRHEKTQEESSAWQRMTAFFRRASAAPTNAELREKLSKSMARVEQLIEQYEERGLPKR